MPIATLSYIGPVYIFPLIIKVPRGTPVWGLKNVPFIATIELSFFAIVEILLFAASFVDASSGLILILGLMFWLISTTFMLTGRP